MLHDLGQYILLKVNNDVFSVRECCMRLSRKNKYAQGLQSLLVEGGSYLSQSFINAELWDEIFVEESPLKLFSGVKAPEIGNKIPYVNEQYFGRNFRHYIATRLG